MTGAEHYAEAERLLAGPNLPTFEGGGKGEPSERDVAKAQVHATLALAVATACVAERDGGLYVTGGYSWPAGPAANPGEGRTDG